MTDIKHRIEKEFERTGDDRLKTKPPKKKIKRGKSAFDKPPSKVVVEVKPRNIFNVITGEVMKERVKRATE